MSGAAPQRTIRFAGFEVYLRSRELRKHGVRIKLQDQPFKILLALLEKPGEVVTREELCQRLWNNDTFVDFDHGLSAAMNRLREALSDSAENPRYIETIARRGYRFVASVDEAPNEAPKTARFEWSRRNLVWAAVPALLMAGLLVWQTSRSPAPMKPLRAVALNTSPGLKQRPSFSPDGNHVVFMWTGPKKDNPDIYVQLIGSAGSPLRLTNDPGIDYNPAWSPDGRWIAFLRLESPPAGKRGLWLIPPLGGSEHKLTEIQTRIFGTWEIPGFVAWCPDSTCLVVTDSSGEGKPDALFVVSLETGEKRQLTSPPPPLLGDTQPAVSPDGRWLAFRRLPAPSAGELYLLPLTRGLTAGGEPTRLTLKELDAAFPAWMSDGKEILYSAGPRIGGALWRLTISGDKAPVRLPFVGEDGLMPTVSRAQPGRPSRLVYVRSFSDQNIWRVETSAPGAPAVSPPVVAISSTRVDLAGDFSPDGRRVAFCSNRTGDYGIWLADPDGANAVQLTTIASAITAAPRWSPDGTLIAFQSNFEGQFDIYVIPARGGKLRRMTSHKASDHVPSFSRDGQWIYFGSNRTADWQVWKVPARGGDAVPVTADGGFLAFEATDGAHLYYTKSPRASPIPLWRIPTSGGTPVQMGAQVSAQSFAVLEKGVYHIDTSHPGVAQLKFFDFASARSTTVAHGLGDPRPLFTASPDGRTILYTRIDSSVDDLMLVENFY